jgi:hypothetical protein
MTSGGEIAAEDGRSPLGH